VLVLRPGALGDTLLAVPALRALRRAYPRLSLAAHRGAARLLEGAGEIDRGLAFDDPSLAWVFATTCAVSEEIVAWMSAPVRSARIHAASRPPDVQHCARYLLDTLAPLGIDLVFDDQPLHVSPIPSEEVLIHPGSGSVAKNWPAERFADVIRGLRTPVRVIVGEADYAAATALEAVRLEQPSLEELAARLAGCRAYLGNDSGVSHLAGLCGAPTFALFGPTDPRVWAPIGPNVHVLPFETSPEAVSALVSAAVWE
jgi:ADP-heptose:LPS heptosyltransferase